MIVCPHVRMRWPDPAAQHVTYFASGASAPGDLRGLAVRCQHPVGVTIPELSEPALIELEALAGRNLAVLVDTGAFSEVEMGPTGFRVVRPIDAAGWEERLAVMARLTRALGPQAYLVAPDRVGDQRVTLIRLAAHAASLRTLRAEAARIVVAIQRGPLPQAAFDRACAEALGFDDFIRGIPGNKDAISTRELLAYVNETRPAAVHLLGMGPLADRYRGVVGALCRANPAVEVSCDSNLIAANVGHTNGRDGGPRPLTAWQLHFERYPDTIPDGWTLREAALHGAFRPQILWERLYWGMRRQGIIFTADGLPPPEQFNLFTSSAR